MAINAFYTANQIVDEALYAMGDNDRRHYNKAVMYFHRGFRDFNLFNNEAIQERWIPITAANTVNFPEDMMRILWTGCSINGELFSFTKSNKIVNPTTAPLDDSLDEERGEQEGIVRSPSTGYNAKAINVEYYYTIDYNKRRIVLKRAASELIRYSDRSEILVGYVGHGVSNMDKTYIMSDAANMLIAYIEWKLTESDSKKYTQWQVATKKQNYEESRNMYDVLSLPSLEELMDCIYETSQAGVRR